MLPFDRRPWARAVAAAVILASLLGAVLYIFVIHRQGPLDWGERAIVFLLLLTIIPPNLLIFNRNKPTHS